MAAGDEPALRRLLDRWRQPVYALFERTREPSSAAEAAAGVFVDLARTASSYKPDSVFTDRLFRLVWLRIKDDPAADRPSIPARRLADSVGARTATLRAAVASLPPNERALFLFTRIAGLPLADAARLVGVSDQEGRRLLVHAMDAISSTLGPLLEIEATGPARGAELAGGGAELGSASGGAPRRGTS